MGFGAPEPDGSTRLDWSPPDGQWDLTLSVVDPDDLSGQDTLSFQFSADLSLSYRWARSAMDARVGAESLGTCTAAALALPTEAAEVWDDGVYTPAEYAADGLAAGRHWASWDQVNPVDCHLFQLTVEVPACPAASSLRLVSPWFDGAPINDDVYVYVDGVAVLSAGTSLGAAQNGPMETASWMAEPLDIPLTLLSPGTHVLDLVVQEYAGWGGLGYLEPTLR